MHKTEFKQNKSKESSILGESKQSKLKGTVF